MSNFKHLDPNDIDESLVKLIEHDGQYHVLLPFVDATGAVPEYRSLGHPNARGLVRMQDLEALSAAMVKRAQDGAAWLILFNTPWLLRRSEGDSIQKQKAARR